MEKGGSKQELFFYQIVAPLSIRNRGRTKEKNLAVAGRDLDPGDRRNRAPIPQVPQALRRYLQFQGAGISIRVPLMFAAIPAADAESVSVSVLVLLVSVTRLVRLGRGRGAAFEAIIVGGDIFFQALFPLSARRTAGRGAVQVV